MAKGLLLILSIYKDVWAAVLQLNIFYAIFPLVRHFSHELTQNNSN